MSDAIRKIKAGDAIMVTTSGGSELHFKVIYDFSGQILMINCNNGVHKNEFWFLTASSLLGDGKLSADIEQHKNIKDTSSIESIMSDVKNWKKKDYKINDFKVFEGAGTDLNCNLDSNLKPKFDINVDTGVIEEPKEDSKENDNEDKQTDLEYYSDLIRRELEELESDQWYNFIFVDGSKIPLKSEGFDNGQVRITEDGNFKLLSKRQPSNMAEKNFKKIASNINFQKANDLVIDTKSVRVTKLIKPKERGGEFKPIFNVNIIAKGFNSEGKQIKTTFSIKKLTNVLKVNNSGDIDDFYKKMSEKKINYKELSDDEIKAQWKQFMEDDKILRNALWRKPNAFLEFIGIADDRGIIPADETLNGWIKIASKNGEKLFKDFKFGEVKYFQFDDEVRITNNKFDYLLDNKIINNQKKYYSIVKKRDPKDVYPNLGTNFDTNRSYDTFNFKINIIEELEDKEDFKKYKVNIETRTEKGKGFDRIGEGQIKIVKSNKDKKKEK
jgi:hypothetical protein